MTPMQIMKLVTDSPEALIRQQRAYIPIDSTFYSTFRSVADRMIALIALIISLPLIIAIAVAIKISTRGPVFYRPWRIGREGRLFRMYKFRTMCEDAEQMKNLMSELNEEKSGLVVRIRKDPRITKVGRILRSTSLDELPQFINVLKGEMALIGPRPPAPDEVAKYNAYQMRRLDSTPGLTGLWQVLGRKELNFDEMVALDIEYAARKCLSLDILILLKTIPAVISRVGAW